MPFSATKESIIQHFRSVGEGLIILSLPYFPFFPRPFLTWLYPLENIYDVRLLTIEGSNKPKGCAFMELMTKEALEVILQIFHPSFFVFPSFYVSLSFFLPKCLANPSSYATSPESVEAPPLEDGWTPNQRGADCWRRWQKRAQGHQDQTEKSKTSARESKCVCVCVCVMFVYRAGSLWMISLVWSMLSFFLLRYLGEALRRS